LVRDLPLYAGAAAVPADPARHHDLHRPATSRAVPSRPDADRGRRRRARDAPRPPRSEARIPLWTGDLLRPADTRGGSRPRGPAGRAHRLEGALPGAPRSGAPLRGTTRVASPWADARSVAARPGASGGTEATVRSRGEG